MIATAIYSITMVLWKETAFPLCREMESGTYNYFKSNVLLLFLFLFIILTPVLNTQGMKKLRCAIQKSTKIKLE